MKKSPFLLALITGLALTALSVRADDPAVPGTGFSASRYEVLWTKSPFAVATAETSEESSPDYFLVGIAKVDGISYASVVERENQEHFLISSDKPTRGLTLTSITRKGSDTYASVQKDGQLLTLKLEQMPTVAGAPNIPAFQMPMPGGVPPQTGVPSSAITFPGAAPTRPFPRIHRPPIHLPPPNGQPQQPGQFQPGYPSQ